MLRHEPRSTAANLAFGEQTDDNTRPRYFCTYTPQINSTTATTAIFIQPFTTPQASIQDELLQRTSILSYDPVSQCLTLHQTDTGDKTADPYTAKNIQDPSLKEKVEDLVSFVDRAKFCMMTTKTEDGLLASRCMALAAKVGSAKEHLSHENSG